MIEGAFGQRALSKAGCTVVAVYLLCIEYEGTVGSVGRRFPDISLVHT